MLILLLQSTINKAIEFCPTLLSSYTLYLIFFLNFRLFITFYCILRKTLLFGTIGKRLSHLISRNKMEMYLEEQGQISRSTKYSYKSASFILIFCTFIYIYIYFFLSRVYILLLVYLMLLLDDIFLCVRKTVCLSIQLNPVKEFYADKVLSSYCNFEYVVHAWGNN